MKQSPDPDLLPWDQIEDVLSTIDDGGLTVPVVFVVRDGMAMAMDLPMPTPSVLAMAVAALGRDGMQAILLFRPEQSAVLLATPCSPPQRLVLGETPTIEGADDDPWARAIRLDGEQPGTTAPPTWN